MTEEQLKELGNKFETRNHWIYTCQHDTIMRTFAFLIVPKNKTILGLRRMHKIDGPAYYRFATIITQRTYYNHHILGKWVKITDQQLIHNLWQ